MMMILVSRMMVIMTTAMVANKIGVIIWMAMRILQILIWRGAGDVHGDGDDDDDDDDDYQGDEYAMRTAWRRIDVVGSFLLLGWS